MVAIRLLKYLKRYVKSKISLINRSLMSFRYLNSKSKSSFDGQYEAHLLLVKNEVYAKIAKICVESFLFYNPNSTVVLHVDHKTKAAAHKMLKKLMLKRKVSILQIETESAPWQDSKLNLILSLGEPKKFFMDADLKWNGPISSLNGITLFVKEFAFEENTFYEPLTSSNWFSEHSNATMKNTSFFHWGTYKPSEDDKKQIESLMNKIEMTTNNQENSSDFNSSTKRISEQIALSLFVEKLNRNIYFLKDSDGFKDGSFVESSYFGATGSSF